MAYSLIAQDAVGSPNGNSVTANNGGSGYDTTGANLIVIAVSWYGGVTPAIADSQGGNSNSYATGTLYSAGAHNVQFFYSRNPAHVGAGHTFTVNATGGFPTIGVAVLSGDGSAGTPPQSGANSSGNVTSQQPGSRTPGGGYLVLTAIQAGNGTSIGLPLAADINYVVKSTNVSSNNHVGGGIAYWIQGSATATNPTWQWTTADQGNAALIVFGPPASGTSATLSPAYGAAGTTVAVTATGSGTSWNSGTTTFSVSGGSGASISGLSINNSTQVATFNLTIGTQSGTLTISDSTDSATATFYAVIPVTNSNLYHSPGNWYSNGSGTMQANNVLPSSTYVLSNNPGASIKGLLSSGSASGSISVLIDTSILNGITAGSTPVISGQTDVVGITPTQLTYAASPTLVSLTASLSAANHPFRLDFQSVDLSTTSAMGDRWNTPATGFAGVKILGWVIDSSSTFAAPTVLSKRAIWFEASGLEGAQNTSAGAPLTALNNDATWSYGRLAGIGIEAEIGIVGFSAQGYGVSGYGNVPPLYNATLGSAAWSNYYSGASRLAQPADIIITNHGINGGASSATVQAWIGQVRSNYPSAWILVAVPWDQTAQAGIAGGVSAYKSLNPGDTRVALIDPGINLSVQGYTSSNSNSHHPITRGDAIAAEYYAGLMNQAMAGSGGLLYLSGMNGGME